jgi:5'-nucleotidase
VRILLSDDDGVLAPGLTVLAEALRKLGEVFICAPDRVRSGASSSLTLHEPLVAQELSPGCWSVSGTPADAVKLALNELMDEPPDIVVSGINNGLNTGSNVVYSGTVAAALEGAQYGITSFAISRKFAENDDFRAESKLSAKVIATLAKGRLGLRTAFNINLPPVRRPKGVLTTVTELTPYEDRFDRRVDPRGRTYFWLRGTPPRELRKNGHVTDDWAIEHGYVSVTPLRRDFTDAALLEDLSRVFPRKA